MKPHPSLAILCLALAAAPALAGDDCDVPVQQWQTRDAALRHAASQGWQVQRLKIDDGCYEIRGRDAQGRPFKAKLDPQTLRVVKMKLGNGEHGGEHGGDHERSRERERVRGQGAPAAAHFAPSASTTPRGQTE